MAAGGAVLTVEALICSHANSDVHVLRSYFAEDFQTLEALGKRLLSDLIGLSVLAPDAVDTANVGFYNYQVIPHDQLTSATHHCASALGQICGAIPAIHKRLDDQIANSPLAISARQNHDAQACEAVIPLLARVALPTVAPGMPVGVMMLSPGEEAQHIQVLVCASTTVGDVRQQVRRAFGVPFGRQRWLSLQRTFLQQRRSLEGTSLQQTQHYDTTYDMLLDDTRTLFSYGGITPGSEIHVAIEPVAPASVAKPASEQHAVSAPLPVLMPFDVAALGNHLGVNNCRTMAEVSCWASNDISAHVPYCMFREGHAMAQAAASVASGWRARA